MIEVLHSDDAHVIEFHRSQQGRRGLLHTFTPFMFSDLRREGFGVGFATRRGYDVVAFKCRDDSWFQRIEPDVLHAVARRSADHSFVATYGSSMGGFAAIAFSGILRADLVIAISPQYAIDLPFDRRWAAQAAAIGPFRHTITPETAHGGRLVLIYDDHDAADLAQVEKIRQETNFATLTDLVVPFSGHPAGHFLAQTGQISRVIGALLDGEDDVVVRHDWSKLRRSLAYTFAMARHANKNGRIGLAILCFSRAVDLAPANAGLRYQLSVLLARTGRLREAIAQAERALSLAPNLAGLPDHLSILLDRAARAGESGIDRSA